MQRVGADAIAGTHILQNEPPRKEKVKLDYRKFQDAATPIVIDNGSYQCRIGWGSETDPRANFRSLVGRPKTRKEGDPSSFVGRSLHSIDWNRINVRSAFDGGISYHLDTQETVFDHAFAHLGIDASSIDHPVLLSECICNPLAARRQMCELLYECYQVQSVAFGVDSLFSWRFNRPEKAQHGLVISAGHSATTVLPIVDGKPDYRHCSRLDVGGSHMTDFLLQQVYVSSALQRNPALRSFISASQAEELKHRFSYLSPAHQFMDDMNSASGRLTDARCIIQLPFTPQAVPSEEELAARTAMRREQGMRLQELSQKRRRDKLSEHQKRLAVLLRLSETTGSASERRAQLAEHGFKTEVHLEKECDDLQDRVQLMLQRVTGAASTAPPKPPRSFDLLEIDNEDLTAEQIKEKAIQKFLKAAALGREKAKLRQQEERSVKVAEENRMKALKKEDPKAWEATVHAELNKLQQKRDQRKRAKQEANDRSSAMYRKRQRLVNAAADLGADDDRFGENDEDWLVYLEMSREDNAEDEDEEARMAVLETMLAEHDPMSMYQSFEEQAAMWQLDIGTSCVRSGEVLFQPSLIGLEQAGLTEIIANVLQPYSPEIQLKIFDNVLVTGGASLTRSFSDRLNGEVTSVRPFGVDFTVNKADDPMLDAWRGAQQWCSTEPEAFQAALTTRHEYEEAGPHYLKEHAFSNMCPFRAQEIANEVANTHSNEK